MDSSQVYKAKGPRRWTTAQNHSNIHLQTKQLEILGKQYLLELLRESLQK